MSACTVPDAYRLKRLVAELGTNAIVTTASTPSKDMPANSANTPVRIYVLRTGNLGWGRQTSLSASMTDNARRKLRKMKRKFTFFHGMRIKAGN